MTSYRSTLAGKLFLDSHRTSSEEDESNTSTFSEEKPASLESENANGGEMKNNVKYDEDDAHNVMEDEDFVLKKMVDFIRVMFPTFRYKS